MGKIRESERVLKQGEKKDESEVRVRERERRAREREREFDLILGTDK